MKPHKIKIIFVCLGNICRSPMAEFIFGKLVSDAGLSDRFEISSAATSDEERGNPVYPPARRKLAEHGIDCSGKTARQLTPELYLANDYVIGMEKRNITNIRHIAGHYADGRECRLLDFVDDRGFIASRDIADPWYTGDFDTAFDEIYRGCQALLNHLIATNVCSE